MFRRGRAERSIGLTIVKVFAWLTKVCWDSHVTWSPIYFVSSVGVGEETIKQYVEHQGCQDLAQLHMKLQRL